MEKSLYNLNDLFNNAKWSSISVIRVPKQKERGNRIKKLLMK